MGRRSGTKRGSRTPVWLRAAFVSLGLVAGVLVAAGAWAYGQLRASLPALDGKVTAPALSARVTVARDAQGVPTLRGRTRADLAWALGYLHGQERFFQMDGQRRSAAGELSDLVGRAALRRDRTVRLHRFRHRAAAVLAAMTAEERSVLDAYVAGVNRGRGDLEAVPFEYLLLRAQPEPWTAEDTVLTGFAMYVSLQEADGLSERRRGAAREVLGQPLADFLFPEGTAWDAPLDGSSLPTAALPVTGLKRAAMPSAEASAVESGASGSNGFVVGGGISTRGSAIVANDLHLGLRVPNIWYRARLVLEDGSGHPTLDITGITLPGAPTIVAGSNGRVAWGFTNSYVDTSDVVVLEPVDGNPNQYRTPDGPMELSRALERLCRICRKPEALMVEESIWGPVIGTDPHGRKLVYRWIAHDPAAVNLRGALELEQAGSVSEALNIAHRMGIPHQNLIAGDAQGNIGWTVTSALPRRFGHGGQRPTSWADGKKGWNGYLAPEEVPVVYNPEGQRLWSANARMVGGEALTRLGFGAYDHGSRARQIRDGLFAQERFSERDLLAIQLDDRGLLLERWQGLLLQALRVRARKAQYAALIPKVESWGGRAMPDSVGYRLVRTFRTALITTVYDAYTAAMPALEPPPKDKRQPRRVHTNQADEPVWRLVREQPGHLVPPGYRNWEAVIKAALSKTIQAVDTDAGGRLDAFTWGSANRAGIKHPLSETLPVLSAFLDPPNEAQPGDVYQPRVARPGFGASDRFVVAPGQESTGIFHMPTSQSGHPLAPYYNLGHEAWMKGQPTPFLPGEAKWQLYFQPE